MWLCVCVCVCARACVCARVCVRVCGSVGAPCCAQGCHRCPVVAHAAFMEHQLWDIMHDQIHPIGVKYADLYDYLGCMGKNPCHGWLTSNATLRNITTEWANSLNDQYTKVRPLSP